MKTGVIGCRLGTLFAGTTEVDIDVLGKDGHAAFPQEANDAVVALSLIHVSWCCYGLDCKHRSWFDWCMDWPRAPWHLGPFISGHGIDTIDHRGNYFSSDCFISCWSNR